MKKVRLTNKQKRIRFAVILITTALVIGRNLPTKKNNDNFLDNFDEVVVVIKPGDRAWNIQSSLTYLWKEFTDLKRLCPGKAKMVGGVMNFHP